MSVEVSELKFGEIDAKNEEFQQARYGSAVFANAFQVPPRINLDELILGARFFVTGQKGCGKTALLLHIRRILSEQGASTNTVLFKTGLNETERQQIASGSGFQVITTGGKIGVQYDYVVNWLWLIYRNLIRLIDLTLVEDGREIAADLKKIMGLDNELKVSPFSDLAISKVKISAKLALNVKPISGEIAGELEAARKEPEERTALQLIEICERFLPKIRLKTRKRCLLFFDELELFWNRPDQRERDLFLIRDLPQSVARANRALGASSASFVVYASVRSEVLAEVNRVGPEIARDVDDFGVAVDWNVTAAAENQPILQIVEAKINASELECDHLPTENVWQTYFPEQIYGRNVEEHLLDVAMFKPRLIVSRLNLAKAYKSSATYFTSEAFEETLSKFSASVWREIEEELLVVYSKAHVQNLKGLLTAFRSQFTVVELEQRISRLGRIDGASTEGFRSRPDIVAALRALYRVGALGNRFQVQQGSRKVTRDRWAFREYEEPVVDQQFVIHESLRKTFQLGYD